MKIFGMILAISVATTAHALTQVKVSFLEALAPTNTTSSERYQKEYETAVTTGKDLTKSEMAKCGYEMVEEKHFFDASDTLQAMESAKKASEAGSWLIVGPRRSNHYLLVTKGAENTPSLSIMASSREVFELPPLHITLAQSNFQMAKVLAQETRNLNKRTAKYLSIVSEDCVACLDFSESFDKSAKKIGLNKVGDLKIAGEQPELKAIETTFKKLSPDIVLLPNYSKVTAYLIGAIQSWKPNTFFIGGDGWGDNKFGFVHGSPQNEKPNGLTVKGYPPADKGLTFFDLGKRIVANPSMAPVFPSSGSAQSILKSIEGVRDLLCKSKPKTKLEFSKAFETHGKSLFKNPWGVSIFELKHGEIVYSKTIR